MPRRFFNVARSTLLSLSDKKIVQMDIDKIVIIDELSSMFKSDEDVLERLVESMKDGFNPSHPLHIFRYKGQWVLIDGHTRDLAARKAGIKKVYVQIHDFKTLEEAKLYSMEEQFNRRNTDDPDLLRQFLTLRDNNLSVKDIAEKTKSSKRQIYKLKETVEKASPEQIKLIDSGEKTINQIYTEIKTKEVQEKEEAKALEEQKEVKLAIENNIDKEKLDLLTDEAVENDIHKEETKKIQKRQRELDEKERELKAVEKKLLSKKDVFILGIKFAIMKLNAGLDLDSILSDTLVQSFNPNAVMDALNTSAKEV